MVSRYQYVSKRFGIVHEALERIGEFCDIGQEIVGKPADARRAVREKLSRPKLEALHGGRERPLRHLSYRSKHWRECSNSDVRESLLQISAISGSCNAAT